MVEKTEVLTWYDELEVILDKVVSKYVNKYRKELLQAAEECETSVEEFVRGEIQEYAKTFDIFKEEGK